MHDGREAGEYTRLRDATRGHCICVQELLIVSVMYNCCLGVLLLETTILHSRACHVWGRLPHRQANEPQTNRGRHVISNCCVYVLFAGLRFFRDNNT